MIRDNLGVNYAVHNMDHGGGPHPSYFRNTNNRDDLSEIPTNAPPTKRGKRMRDPECAPGCTFELVDRYDEAERRASTGGIITVRDAGDQTVEADVREKRVDQSGPPSPDSETRSRLDIVFRQDAEQWVRMTTARTGQ